MFDAGDPVPLSVTVRNAAGNPENAGAVTLTITQPDLTVATPATTNTGPGVYTATFTPVQTGRHLVRWVATGTNASAFTDVFDVRPAASTALFSLADARKALNLSATTQDEELRDFIDAVTAVVEQRVGAVVPRTVVEVVRARGRQVMLSVTPVMSITSIDSLLVGGWPVPATDLRFDADTGAIRLYSRSAFSDDFYTVTYVAGRTGLVPPNISLAARIILKHLWRTQQGPTARPGANSDPMSVVAGQGYAIPNAAEELLSPHLNMDGIA